jgi:hypothetical protein
MQLRIAPGRDVRRWLRWQFRRTFGSTSDWQLLVKLLRDYNSRTAMDIVRSTPLQQHPGIPCDHMHFLLRFNLLPIRRSGLC